ncbi:hypothetical protein [Roseixanthobacter glucoisosaccharinicivorans]|uniref:hypothetical protein n=1 Tax=Roseixanthobacter glucoisosaccharinicivorans TaxID=3119923 RepID=UPI00372623E9
MRGIVRPLACVLFLAAALPAAADALGDYVAARDTAIAASVAAAKAGKSGDAAVVMREQAAFMDLGKRLATALGPLKFKGLGPPIYTLLTFTYDESSPTHLLDGLDFGNKDVSTRLVVTPQSVFQTWLAARAKDDGAPAALAGGVKTAMATAEFFQDALAFDGGYYQPYVDLPVAAAPGETALAVLGLQADEPPGNIAPNQIAIVRIADGKAMVGLTMAKLNIKPIAACEAIWKPYKAKAEALQKAIEKDNKSEDPRWEELTRINDAGSQAFRACFAKEAPAQPFFPVAVKRADALLDIARGK